MSIKSKIIENGIANAISNVVRVGDQLLLVPFFIIKWGAAYYGEWLTLTIIPSILAYADFGLGTASANCFVLEYSKGNREEAADNYKTGLFVVTLSVVIGFLFSLLIIYMAKLYGYLDKSIINTNDIIISLLFLMISKLIGFYFQIYEAFFRVLHKASWVVNYKTLEGCIRIGVSIIILMIGSGVVLFAFVQLCIAIISNLIFALWGVSLIKGFPVGKIKKGLIIQTVKKGFGFLLMPIWQVIYFQGTTFAVRVALGAESVAIFNTIRALCRSVNAFFGIVSASIFPELQIAYGEGKIKETQNIFIKAYVFSIIIAIFGSFIILFWGLPLYNLWTLGCFHVPSSVWTVFTIGILLNSIWWVPGVVFRAINRPYYLGLCCLFTSLLSVIACYALSIEFGFLGTALGYIVMDILLVLLIPPTAANLLGIKITKKRMV